MKKALNGLDVVIQRFEEVVCVIALLAIVSIATASVIGRYVFKTGFLWADEVSQALLVAMGMFGSARAVRTKSHTEFTTFSSKPKSKTVRMAIRAVIAAITLFFLVFLLISSTQYAAAGRMLSVVLRIPRKYYYASIPIGFALCIYEYLRAVKSRVVNDPVEKEE